MTDTLFDLPESKSPRLLWMEEQGIACIKLDLDLPENAWQAMHAETQTIVRGPTDLDAIADLARKLNLKLWNEQ